MVHQASTGCGNNHPRTRYTYSTIRRPACLRLALLSSAENAGNDEMDEINDQMQYPVWCLQLGFPTTRTFQRKRVRRQFAIIAARWPAGSEGNSPGPSNSMVVEAGCKLAWVATVSYLVCNIFFLKLYCPDTNHPAARNILLSSQHY